MSYMKNEQIKELNKEETIGDQMLKLQELLNMSAWDMLGKE